MNDIWGVASSGGLAITGGAIICVSMVRCGYVISSSSKDVVRQYRGVVELGNMAFC